MPIRWRLTLFNALAIGGILLVSSLARFFLLRGSLFSGLEDTVRNRAVTAAREVEAGEELDTGDDELTLDGVFIVVRDGRGRVLSRTAELGNGAEDQVWSRALESGRPEGGAAGLPGDGSGYVYAVPVDPASGAARVVEAGKSYEAVEETLDTFAGLLAVVVLFALLLSAIGAYLMARAALSPVEDVVGAAREITAGDLSRRLPVANPKDEIGRLATTVNGLLSRLEAAFARREEALERQRRFAADASHELRTPLTSVIGHARMLDEWALEEDPNRARRSVAAIRREAGRMRTLVESLLALTRGDECPGLEVGRHDLAAVAGEAVQTARDTAEGKVSIEYVTPEHEVWATIDRGRVLQVASILMDNAVKYTPKGGSVVVELREEDGLAAIEVSDTGVGIPEDRLPLVFERFYRADPSRADGGAGLGLSIARQIAGSHGGEIRAESTPGKGSTFTLLLPKKP
ncbi:MAG: HAMP domain-containing histidine kinase [Rubrobacter sp.]|nr:HAMP domain-containing histidine kinase [Rubrobacter sp.]